MNRRTGQRSRGRRRGFVFSLRLTEAELTGSSTTRSGNTNAGEDAAGTTRARNSEADTVTCEHCGRTTAEDDAAFWMEWQGKPPRWLCPACWDEGRRFTFRAAPGLAGGPICSLNGCGGPAFATYSASEDSSYVRSGPWSHMRTGPRRGLICHHCFKQGLWDDVGRPVAVSGGRRIILDLCSGTGAWSEPYVSAGYDVRRITLPSCDVRSYVPPDRVWGVLAAPPCEAFSLARNGTPATEDELTCGLGVVSACLRIIATCRPCWWALENPVGRLGHCLGTPTYTFQPWWFGDPWTKRTSLWGTFNLPRSGPDTYTTPNGSAAERSTRVERARTPPGFARAFFEANP